MMSIRKLLWVVAKFLLLFLAMSETDSTPVQQPVQVQCCDTSGRRRQSWQFMFDLQNRLQRRPICSSSCSYSIKLFIQIRDIEILKSLNKKQCELFSPATHCRTDSPACLTFHNLSSVFLLFTTFPQLFSPTSITLTFSDCRPTPTIFLRSWNTH